nr:hypothetical protein [Tanacetum cinerariifolium]
METTIEQQVAMDEALVPSAQRLRIRRSNFRMLSDIQSKESTLQLVYDVLRRCPFFKAFMVIADVPEIYMQEFWATANVHHHAIHFKMDNKKYIVNLESFRDMLHICPRILGQSFVELPFEEEILDFIQFLRQNTTIRTLTDVNINKLYQPWRSFAAIINKCLTGKSSGYDSLRLSQAQILWGLYHKRNVNYAFLIWEDFVYQVKHKNQKKSNEIYYPRFTKVIIHHFMSKDLSIPRRNTVNWHYVRDDFMFSMIKLVSRHQNTQPFGALLPIELTNEEIKNSKEYKEYYAIATGEATPKSKASARRTRSGSDTSITPLTTATNLRPTAAATLRLTAATKGKQTAKAPKAKSLSALSKVAMIKAQQLQLVIKQSRQHMHMSQPGGSGTDEGTGSKPGVPNVPTNESKEELSWNSFDDEGADDQGKDDAEGSRDDDEEGESDEEDDDEETRDEESFEPIPQTPESSKDNGNGEEDQGLKIGEEERLNEEEEADELYRDIDINQGRGIQATLEVEDSHVTLTLVNPDGVESIFATASTSMAPLPTTAPTMTPSIIAAITTTSQALIPPTTVSSDVLVEAYEADKIILDTYEETVTLKRRRDDDDDKDEGPSAGPDRGSKRRREGTKPESASALSKTATRSTGRSTTGSRSRQASASESAFAKELVQTTSQIEEPSHSEFDTADSRSSFNELMDTPLEFSNFIMNRLRVDTLTPELLAGPTYELMKVSCKSLIELEYHLEEVYKATTDQLDWPNPEGVSHWGRKRQQFYGFAVNWESACDVYSKRKIIAITKLKIVEWHSYKHLDWITVRRDDDKLYKFKEGDFKRLRIQDIKDMLLFLIQGKLSNLTVEERFTLNVSLRMLTRSIVIQRRVEDLQLGVESYQKRLNLTKPDTLMRIDELHKFSDGRLTDVRIALDDHLKRIRMRYLPQIIWIKSDKDRAAAMIQAIDKMLKTRRIMRSLEWFLRGRLYEGDFRMLHRTL